MILTIQLKYTMKMKEVSDSSQTEQNCSLLKHHIYLITFTRMEPYIGQQQQQHEKKEQKRSEEKHLKD